jgi:hypothetical protein
MVTTRCIALIIALGFAACATAVWGQPPDRVPIVGLLALSASPKDTIYEALREGLRERGYVEGRMLDSSTAGHKDTSSSCRSSQKS